MLRVCGAVMLHLRILRMASFMAISRTPVSRFPRRFFRSPRLPVLTSLDYLATRSLASLGDYHDGHFRISRAPVSHFAQRVSRSLCLPVITSLDDLASRSLTSLVDYHDKRLALSSHPEISWLNETTSSRKKIRGKYNKLISYRSKKIPFLTRKFPGSHKQLAQSKLG